MRNKKKTLPLLENVKIDSLAAEGMSIAKTDNGVLFVPFGAPGDVVDIQVTKKKHKYMEGRIVNMVSPSDCRLTPFCQHFGVCGGCRWQHIPYELQLESKQEQVYSTLKHLGGGIVLPECSPILGSQNTDHYRNKLEFTCSAKRWKSFEEMEFASEQSDASDEVGIGFHIPRLFDKVLDIKQCYLMDDINNVIRLDIRQFALANSIPFYNIRERSGCLRNIVIRQTTTGQLMLVVVFNSGYDAFVQMLMSHLSESFPQITSLLYVINDKVNDSLSDLSFHTFSGQDYITEKMEDLTFKIGPKSFYQTNSRQAYELYKIVRQFAHLNGSELVYDLYTGTGTIACFLAKQCRKVIGIEYVEDAIVDAKDNAAANNINNAQFYAGDMKDILTEDFVREHGVPDVLITDPPRAGMHTDVVNVIMSVAPRHVVYVSCNPATQARDLSLMQSKYKVEAIQPVDMFPHTQHVENVVLLSALA